MAGVFADVPGHRFAYDVDGTLVKTKRADGTVNTGMNWGFINDEDASDTLGWGYTRELGGAGNPGIGTPGIDYLIFVFPQLRNLLGYYINYFNQAITMTWSRTALQVSADTTDGTDGTWTQIVTPWVGTFNTSPIAPTMRTQITAVTGADNIKGVRFGVNHDGSNNDTRDYLIFNCLHLYGTIVGANNGLRLWHPTLDQEVGAAYFDFGDQPQGTSTVKQFRIKNTSAQLATTVTVSAESQTGSDAGLATGLSFSQDNVTYGTSTVLTSIAAGVISPICYAKRTVGGAEAQALRAARIKAVTTTWT